MREIKFRGISDCDVAETNVTEGMMIFGQVVFQNETPYIVGSVIESNDEYIAIECWCPIRPETLGQFTGLKDKNGVEIYEGDIVRKAGEVPGDDSVAPIEYCGLSAMFVRRVDPRCSIGLCVTDRRDIEVIGNVFEHPELLKAATT